ncbi:hypothetical protein NEF87_002390 [Candidatus Lokiarchaeum ossiferum]|uniref:Uncharacterized protein n=1 Tax=Candidatus Lokiarchaeum ossiferum TaxID=2951803 RepID=A0ABY6HRH3_9ARCH|nr:hypothetical protein NEF87_002390 [Candidatus Lokiarchaeum sp. B-35]
MLNVPNDTASEKLDVQQVEHQYLELLHEKQTLRLRCNELKDAYFDKDLSDKACYSEFEQISRRLMQIDESLLKKAKILEK